EPVLAGPPGVGYRVRKFVRRNRGAVVAAASVVLALVAGIIGTTWQWRRVVHERNEKELARLGEEDQRKTAEAVKNFLQKDLLRQANAWEQAETVRLAGGPSN